MRKVIDIFLLWRGRVSKKTYWLCGLLPAIAISLFAPGLGLPVWQTQIVLSVAIYVGLMLSIKRSHDLGRTGFFSLVLFVPLLNLWPLIMFGLFNGTEGDNKYGPPDRRFPHLFVNE